MCVIKILLVILLSLLYIIIIIINNENKQHESDTAWADDRHSLPAILILGVSQHCGYNFDININYNVKEALKWHNDNS